MKCPACHNELSALQTGSLVVDVCRGGCGGIWFDAFELQRVDEEEETAGEMLLHIERDPRVVVDALRKRECPRCTAVKLHRHFFSAKRSVEVDECPNCGGYWLDAGELASIRLEKHASQSAERLAHTVISGGTIRYLYTLQNQARTSASAHPVRPRPTQP
jgi:Zn-finger nucleic acid-binding protein